MGKIDDNLDPIVAAALMDDPTDDEEELKFKKEALSLEEEGEGEDDGETPEDDGQDIEPTDNPDEQPEDKPAEKPDEPGEEEPTEKKTRKERRAERKAAFIDAIKREEKENAQHKQLFQPDPNYQPLNYEAQEEFKAGDLEADRSKYGQQELARGAQLGEFYAKQNHFWDTVELENKVLSSDPKFTFLNETLPDGQPNPSFDEDKAGDINEMYLELVGFDPQKNTVKRTDISYEKFVRRYVERIEDWIEDSMEHSQKNLAAQQSKSGIRPSGSSKKGIGKLRPGSISSMSDEEFEKHEADIDRQINDMLGI